MKLLIILLFFVVFIDVVYSRSKRLSLNEELDYYFRRVNKPHDKRHNGIEERKRHVMRKRKFRRNIVDDYRGFIRVYPLLTKYHNRKDKSNLQTPRYSRHLHVE